MLERRDEVEPLLPVGPQRIQSVERALALLRAVAAIPPGQASLAALAAHCGINRSTAWRLLATLQQHQFVERDAATNSYRLGVVAFQLAGSEAMHAIVRRARRTLLKLAAASGEAASLALPEGLALVYVDQVAAPTVLTPDWLGRQVVLHATSTGKAYLAWVPAGQVASLLPGRLERFTSTTVVDPRAFRHELEQTRQRGFGVCRGELESMLWGVSAPVLNAATRPVAVVSIWGSSTRVREDRFTTLGALVVDAAARVARELELR